MSNQTPNQSSLKSQMLALASLQEIDLKIDGLKKKKISMPAEMKEMDLMVLRAKGSCDLKQNSINDLEKGLKQNQAAMDLNNDRMTRANAKLDQVQNGGEFQAANREIDQLKKMNLGLEEQMKKIRADVEKLTGELTALQEAHEKAKADRDSKTQALQGQGSDLDAQIGALTAERAPFVAVVAKNILSQYERVRGARQGLGLVPAMGGRCGGCNMVVPPQLYNMVQKGLESQSCPSCHRILFIPEARA